MTRVDFYVLQAGAEQQRAVFACRLAEKAHRHGLSIHIHTRGPAATANLDKLLWTFRDGSFLPHLTVDEAAQADPQDITRVHVGHGESSGPTDGLLINIGEDVPLFFSRFDRVAEIVGDDKSERERARDRFRFYRDRGYTLNTHKL
ncbi:MAG: DNA polymerase III subunit chi [Chromatiales bacterium]|nr:DNA polymerase III subunit chi [Chromatiales bacterium]MDH4030807.1 DNA polymerase III subunit chi [Chromatiales bacterium]